MKIRAGHWLRATILSLISIWLLGCAGGQNPVEPPSDEYLSLVGQQMIPGNTSLTGSDILPETRPGNRHTLGLYVWTIDRTTGDIQSVPLRTAETHYNIATMLYNNAAISIEVVPEETDLSNGLLTADVSITHPFDQNQELCAFDVRGILIAPGSETIDPLVFGGLEDLRLLNADGFTRWWNPPEFPAGCPFGYDDQPLGWALEGLTGIATVNPYKVYANLLDPFEPLDELSNTSLDDPNGRGIFSPGKTRTRRYSLSLPASDPLRLNYAIDACWVPPINTPPEEIPGDFPMAANCQEAYWVTATLKENTLWAGEGQYGGLLTVRVAAHDWQGRYYAGQPDPPPTPIDDQISIVRAYAPDLFAGGVTLEYIEGSDDGVKAKYEITLDSELKSIEPGIYPMLIRVGSADGLEYKQWDWALAPEEPVSAYQLLWVEVSEADCEEVDNDTCETAAVLEGSDILIHGCVSENDPFDWYSFSCEYGVLEGEIDAWIVEDEGSIRMTRLEGPCPGTEIETDQGTWPGFNIYMNPATSYLVRIEHVDGEPLTQYGLSIEFECGDECSFDVNAPWISITGGCHDYPAGTTTVWLDCDAGDDCTPKDELSEQVRWSHNGEPFSDWFYVNSTDRFEGGVIAATVDGTNVIEARIRDEAGNYSDPPESCEIEISGSEGNNPPTVEITNCPEQIDNATFEFKWQYNDDYTDWGYAQFDIKKDDGDWVSITNPMKYTWSSITEGYHTIYVRTWDLGIPPLSGEDACSFRLGDADNYPPTVEITNCVDEVDHASYTFEWTMDDDLTDPEQMSVKINKDDSGWVLIGTGSTSYLWYPITLGPHTFRVQVTDKGPSPLLIGEDICEFTRIPTVDDPPIVTITNCANISPGSYTFEWDMYDDDTPPEELYPSVYMDGGPPHALFAGTTSYTWNSISSGPHTFEVKVIELLPDTRIGSDLCEFNAGTDDIDPPVWDDPVGVAGVSPGDGELTVLYGTATDEKSPPVEYLLYIDDDSNPWDQTPVVRTSTTPYTFDGLTNWQSYWCGVRCRDSAVPPNVDRNTITQMATPAPVRLRVHPKVYLYDGMRGVAVDDGAFTAYLVHPGALCIVDVYPPSSAHLVKSLITAWGDGPIDVELGYAYVSHGDEIQIVDVVPPEDASVVNTFNTISEVNGFAVNDYYAYVACAFDFLLVFDVWPPQDAHLACLPSHPDLWIGTDVAFGINKAFVSDLEEGLGIFDITNPESTTLLGDWQATTGSDQAIAVSGMYAYVAESGNTPLKIINVLDPGSPSLVGSVSDFDNGIDVDVDYGYTWVIDQAGDVHLIDTHYPTDPVYLTKINSPLIDHARAVDVWVNMAFIADDTGLVIIEIE